jgi:hypothetical protein
MSYWGMWYMNKHHDILATQLSEHVRIIQNKRCCGYKGHWECADDYPDRMVPVSEFSDSPSRGDGYQPRCNRCNRYVQNQQPVHPDTGQTKRGWKAQRAVKLGGDSKNKKTPEWKSYLDGAEVQWNIEWKNHLLNTAPAQEVLAFMGHTKHNAQKLTERNLLAEKLYGRKEWNIMMKAKQSNIAPFTYPPEHEKILKFAGRSVESAIKARNANKDDGFTYTLTHPLWPEIKIGYTYNPPSRLSQFNTCCPHKLFSMPYISTYLKDAKLAEEAIHETLKEHRADGEWFNVSLEIATKTIEDYVRSLDDTKE